MSGMIRTRKRQALVTMFAALALVLGGSLSLVACGQAQATGTSQAETSQDAPYKSSIQVPNDDSDEDSEDSDDSEKGEGNESNEASEQDEATSPKEQAEAARYQTLARITADQARNAALTAVPGTAMSVELENEDGNLVYGVSVKTSAGERDVKVDAGNGKVLHIEKDD